MTRSDRPFDIVVYGATGYTGRLVAEYLASHYPDAGPKWAMAGRNLEKLAEVRTSVGAPADTPLIVADSDDAASLAALAGQARVVLIYDEMVLTGPGDEGKAIATHMATTPVIGGDSDPRPGEGPTKEERDNGFYDVLFAGEYPDGRTIRYGVKGRYDPGYGSTCRMIAETGIALLDCEHPGGVATPGALLGPVLVDRLRAHAEIDFAVED
jgi:short subunit dehydrogenase-like uncharacterized protein